MSFLVIVESGCASTLVWQLLRAEFMRFVLSVGVMLELRINVAGAPKT
jgi:hypothetical protein